MSTTHLVQGQGIGGDYLFLDPSADRIVGPESLPSHILDMAASVRGFIDGEVTPRIDEIDAMDGTVTTALLRQFGDLGFFSMEIPEALGGMGLSLLEMLPMIEHLGRAGSFGVAAMVHEGIGMQSLCLEGLPDVVARHLPELMTARKIAAYCLTEPGSGSDALGARSTAAQDPMTGEWIINGSKQWITNASWADVFTVFAQVDGTKFTAFLVERGTPGFAVLPEEHKLGLKGSSTCALRLTNVRVPADHLVGQVGRGHKLALNMLSIGRLKLGMTNLGAMKQLLHYAITYTNERVQFGKPISSFTLIRRKLVEMAWRIFAGEAVAYRTAAQMDMQGVTFEEGAAHMTHGGSMLSAAEEFTAECSMSKIFLTESAAVCADHAVQCYGGYGFSEEYPVARYYRDLRISRIYEGTNEINRLNIANTLLRRVAKGPLAEIRHQAHEENVREGNALQRGFAECRSVVREVINRLTEKMPESGKPPFEQDVLAAFADMQIALYSADSAIRRAAIVQGRFPQLMASLTLQNAALQIEDNARLVLGSLNVDTPRGLSALSGLRKDLFANEREAAQMLLSMDSDWPVTFTPEAHA